MVSTHGSIRALAIAITALVVASACGAATPPSAPAATATAAAATQRPPTEQEKWLVAAKLGPNQPATEDLNELVEAAKKEGKVVVYSFSSRIAQVAKTFEEKYPGIKVEWSDIPTSELTTKAKSEQQAGLFNADVLFNGDSSVMINEVITKGLAWAYVPAELKGLIAKEFREPALVQSIGIRAVIYNTEVNQKPPIDSWWDLTRPEWKGKVVMPDPLKDPAVLDQFVTFVQRADEMAAAYQKEFGEPIKLSPGVPTAGHEWITRLADNKVVLVASTDDVGKAVGQKGQKAPPIGITAYARIRDAFDGKLAFDVAFDVAPVMGITTPNNLSIANRAPHPNAAKLLVRWLMGDEKGGQGFTPYYTPGNLSVRSDVPPVPLTKALKDLKVWNPDYTLVYTKGVEIRDFWLKTATK